MRQKKIKQLFIKHFNCLPWLVGGIYILIDGNISRWQFSICWVCNLLMIWMYTPIRTYGRAGEGLDRNEKL